MAAITDYLENKLLDHTLRNTAYTPAVTIYCGLYTTATADDGTGTEVTGGSYARQSVAFDAAAGGSTANTSIVTYPTASAPWGTVTHNALNDASTSGNNLYHGALTASKPIGTSDVYKYAAGAITVSLN